MPSVVVVEGDVDRAIVTSLLPGLALPKPERPRGRDAAIRDAALAAKQVSSPHIALLLDRNGFTPEQIEQEVARVFREAWQSEPIRNGPWFCRGESAVRVVLAGLPQDSVLRQFGIERFTSDDYLLKLVLHDSSLREFCAGESHLGHIPTNAASLRQMLEEVVGVLRSSGIPIKSSKQYLHLVRAIISFEASRATFAQHLIERSPPTLREQILGSLRDDLTNDLPL